ncbi:MAG: ISAs1 family transposase [bacterium]|nr:ISAs1 family transposase [bacterium]
MLTVKDNQPTLAEKVVDLPWWNMKANWAEEGRGHGRMEERTIRVRTVDPAHPLPGFPSARQIAAIVRERTNLRGEKLGEPEIVFAITNLSRREASPRALAVMLRGHWCIENSLHYVRDVTFDEDRSRIRTGAGPRVMASLRNLAIAIHRLNGEKNIASATRRCCRVSRRAFARLAGRAVAHATKAA